MRNLLPNHEQLAPSEKPKVFSKPLKITLTVVVVVILTGYAGAFAWAQTYENRVAPNVWIGSVKIGGMEMEAAKTLINSTTDELMLNGIQLFVDGKAGTVPLMPTSAETGEYVILEIDETLSQAQNAHKRQNKFLQPIDLLIALTGPTKFRIPVEIKEDELTKIVLNTFPKSIENATDSTFTFTKTEESWKGEATPSAEGLTISTDGFFSQLKNLLTNLDPQPIVMTKTTVKPKILENHVKELIPLAEEILNNAPYSFIYEENSWEITDKDLTSALMITFVDDTKIAVTVSEEGFLPTLEAIAEEIETPAIDARLKIEGGRVSEFQPSSNGLTINKTATLANLSEIFHNHTDSKTAELIVEITEPTVKMGGVNDIGINEILGVGTSSYKGSPTNRIKNIKNGVRLLNGLLIAPGEEFSLLNALKPFELDNGYLPELVIKGDKIEPEIAGGLCQIGTTTFRAAMNSGLNITSRRNHSLVVSYYNDPSNGNPGTDATIYDPAPDFKFINDTGNYILFQAEIDETNYKLNFSFWGTSDGRKGSYEPPTVIRWIPVGETQITETTDLEPGVEQCQSAHVGADTTFTYTITNPDGTTTDTVYESHYRPLPKICLIGIEEVIEEEIQETEDNETTTTPETPSAP